MAELVSTLNNIEELKLNYAKAMSNYENARLELAELTAEYDKARHTKRTELYKEKLLGAKYSEECIRSMTIAEFANLNSSVIHAQAKVDCYKAELDFARDMFLNHTNN